MNQSSTPSRILEIGKDARTDAIAAACLVGGSKPELIGLSEFEIPGLLAKCSELVISDLTNPDVLEGLVAKHRPDLAIVGPEDPLEAGYADELERLGVPTFGPRRALAAIESSKSFARRLLDTHDIPGNPENQLVQTDAELNDYAHHLGEFVVKPDGLTGGKGVQVQGDHFQTVEEGIEYARQLLAKDGRVQIEEKLIGEEFSLQTITDGTTFIHCPVVQDHKRAWPGDLGPNTGGMGSYSCPDHSLPFLEAADLAAARAVNERVIRALKQETGVSYCGVLYGGFIATRSGIKVIEYNCRFGDPEALNVLPILAGSFLDAAWKATQGRLHEVDAQFASLATVCKYIVPRDYPARTTGDLTIEVPDQLLDGHSSAQWFWAGCQAKNGRVTMTGSRAGAVVGIGETVAEAERVAEEAAARVRGNVRHRHDIGTAELIERRVARMRDLRGVHV